ncbi:MAG TPA: hypothetical protein VLS25_03800 [Dehalococcoidia bacterium]|nr:hypothetical protein [Dehalococcoidia bacterium]
MCLGALMLAMVFLLILLAKPGGDTAVTWIDDITLAVFSLAATVFTAAAAVRNRGSRRGIGWALISIGLLMNTFGEVAWGIQELAMGKQDVFPSVADVGYLGLYPPVFLGLLLLPQAPSSGFWRLKMSIDVLVGVAAVAAITSTVVLNSVISASDTTGTERAVSLAYPLADLAIIFAVLALIARSGSSSAVGPLVFLALGFGGIAFSDSLYTYLTQIGKYDSGSYIDAGWLAGYTLVAMAGAARAHVYASSEPTAAAEDDPPRLWQQVAMYTPVVALAGLILVDADLRQVLPLAAFIGIVGLMFVRQLITHSEILRIYERQLGFADELESKVRAQTLELWHRRAWEKKEHDPADVILPAPTRDWDGGEAPPIPSPSSKFS